MPNLIKRLVYERIVFHTDMPIYEVEERLRACMSGGNELFPKSILSGKIYGTKLSATINVPGLISNPFNSIVSGSFASEKEGTRIRLTVTFGIIDILVLIFWYIPLFSLLQQKQNLDVDGILLSFGACSLLSFFSFVLLRAKMKWHKKQMESWLFRNLVK